MKVYESLARVVLTAGMCLATFAVSMSGAAADPFAFGIADGGDLYRINFGTKSSTRIFDEINPSFASPNALAYDAAGNSLYYRNATTGNLYQYNMTTGVRSTNGLLTSSQVTTIGSADDAAFWGGSYWFVRSSSDTLVRISNLTTTPSIATFDLSALTSPSLSFGDIAITSGGILYGHTSNNQFFSANIGALRTAPSGSLTASSFSLDSSTNVGSLQIAFSPTETVLYGHNFSGTTANNRWYTVDFSGNATTNTSFGNATAITGWNDSLNFRDIAGSVVPEPSTLVSLGLGGMLGLVGIRIKRLRRPISG